MCDDIINEGEWEKSCVHLGWHLKCTQCLLCALITWVSHTVLFCHALGTLHGYYFLIKKKNFLIGFSLSDRTEEGHTQFLHHGEHLQ